MALTLTAKHDLQPLDHAGIAYEVVDADSEHTTIRLHHTDLSRLREEITSSRVVYEYDDHDDCASAEDLDAAERLIAIYRKVTGLSVDEVRAAAKAKP